MLKIHTYMYMPPLTIFFYNNCTFKSFFTCFGFKIWFLKTFLDRSASFFGQETHEHVKTIRKRCLEAKNHLFRKMQLTKRHVFPKVFPPCSDCWSNFAHFGSKTDFLMKFLDDSAWFCLEKLKNMFFQGKTLTFI